ncbi:hypothetical protein Dimus_009491 [Dionaea muscipula]
MARLLLAAGLEGIGGGDADRGAGAWAVSSVVGGGFLLLCVILTMLSVMAMIMFACGDDDNHKAGRQGRGQDADGEGFEGSARRAGYGAGYRVGGNRGRGAGGGSCGGE